jgi:hypothetical protein
VEILELDCWQRVAEHLGCVLCVEGSGVTVLVTVGTDWAQQRYGTV